MVLGGPTTSLSSFVTQSAGQDFFTPALQSFCLVASAELFDKTWFVAMLMAVRYPKGVVLWFCFLALALHTIIAAVVGYCVSRTASLRMLHFGAAALYIVFAGMFLRDWYKASPDSDIISAGKEEAGEAIAEESAQGLSYGSVGKAKKRPTTSWYTAATRCFTAMFIAEWGDRTQIAMVGQHASQPLLPVCFGSLVAFFILTGTAVIAGVLLKSQTLSEKMVHLFSAMSFVVFALLALKDGLSTHAAPSK